MIVNTRIGAEQIRPILDRILVRCDKRQFTDLETEGGIIIPDTVAHTEQSIGTVVAVGPGKWWNKGYYGKRFVATYVKPGDQILFAMEGSEPLSWLDDKEFHYEMVRSEVYVLGTL